MTNNTRVHSGFSLIEVMITVAVIAILSAVALPSYRSYVMRANRSEAKAALINAQVAEEKYFLQNSTYGTLAQIGILASTAKGYYSIGVSNVSATTYKVTATAQQGQASDTTCGTMEIDQSGTKNPADTSVCWK